MPTLKINNKIKHFGYDQAGMKAYIKAAKGVAPVKIAKKVGKDTRGFIDGKQGQTLK